MGERYVFEPAAVSRLAQQRWNVLSTWGLIFNPTTPLDFKANYLATDHMVYALLKLTNRGQITISPNISEHYALTPID